MSSVFIRVRCIRFRRFKEKIRLVKKYLSKGYKVEILNDRFVYAERAV